MAFSIDSIFKWCASHWYIFLIAFILYFVWNKWLKGTAKLKPIYRAEIERKNFIERNRHNKTSFKWLWRGNKLLGSIKFLRRTNLSHKEGDPESPAIEIVYTPSLFGLKIPNFFAKDVCIMINAETTESIFPSVTIEETASFDKFMGIYYDRKFQKQAEEYIKIDNVFRTDLENLTSIYYAKAQEQSTIQPQFAHETLAKQQDIELEKQKRARIGG